jgi:hypothetical protein
MGSLRDDAAGADARLRKRIPLDEPLHLIPGDRRFLRAAAQPLLPRTTGLISEHAERPQVADDAVVRVVTEQLSLERLLIGVNYSCRLTTTILAGRRQVDHAGWVSAG